MNRKALVAAVGLVSLVAAVSGCGSSRPASVSSDSATATPSAPRDVAAPGAPLLSAPAAAAAGAALPLVPEPSEVTALGGTGYRLTARSAIRADGGPAATGVAALLTADLDASTGLRLPVPGGGAGSGTGSGAGSGTADDGVTLRLDPAAGTGPEGYGLVAGPGGVVITAADGAGLFHGAQTLRQLLPARGAGTVAAVRITDRPRYPVRSVELDVARHFFPVPVVERIIDLLAEYKINYLHLHLTDDQGWRIEIPGLPRLTGIGAATEVGGGPGGSYTDADYRAITAYAAARYVTVVPEVDLPAHTNAALTAYPDLACAGTARPRPYTGIGGPGDSLCADGAGVYAFVDQVVGTLAALTPGRYLDIGGDEAFGVSAEAYDSFMARAAAIVRAHGKQPMAWEDAAGGGLGPALLGAWHPAAQLPPGLAPRLAAAVRGGSQVLLEPAEHAYLDQKYDRQTGLGLSWAGYVGVPQAYDWDPGTFLRDVPAASVAGVEAALWTETLATPQDLESMLLPRLPALAEVAWTPQQGRVWSAFRLRLAAQAPRWDAQGLDWTRVDGIPWR
ncbi:beta-N-acetylhexosaminidase [Streptacidiphilus sp. P02-A3a]|uniref:beta-N-acetylhexosaminidase n=1 Tax=Streptacidiphilus sp. P02-A3a TaxID=2704468 RepID=UPI0015FB634B|nr:beta-N-acetylhexosaminidase [Streptacidiphilus sp. P02-A3a]QMU67936.1 family 20 glycosylhydrolase [Streptacidiphilus sp. P02-A3a]